MASEGTRNDILGLMDGFIEQIQQIRNLLLGMSISAIVIGPMAIGLAIYMLLHPSFFNILETENEFGLTLSILLGTVIIISGIWVFSAIRQYRSMEGWKKKYEQFQKEKQDMDEKIAAKFGLGQD
jgi:hypothetical protein